MKTILNTFLIILSLAALNAEAQPNRGGRHPRTVFVQLFEWPWKDVALECENYLGPKGFSAVQVSPPNEHLLTPLANWWERYQIISYKINTRSGDEAEFADMVRRCKVVGVDIYVDAVLNHMSGMTTGMGFAGSSFTHYNYPGTYSSSDFHQCGRNGDNTIQNENDPYELLNCDLVGLADLKTESDYVQKTEAAYLNRLLSYGVAGFRLDAAKHMPAKDIHGILGRLNKPAYIIQELFTGKEGLANFGDYLMNGDVMVFPYPITVGQAFRNKQAWMLPQIANGLPNSEDAVVFIDNHDLERGNSDALTIASDRNLYRLAQIFMLAWPYGYPHLFSGFEFNTYDQGPPVDAKQHTTSVLDSQGECQKPWVCPHRLPEIAAMVDFRNLTGANFKATDIWTNNADQLAFGRGDAGYVVINYSDSNLSRNFQTSLPAGEYCNIVARDYDIETHSCGQGLRVDARGRLNISIAALSAAVLLKQSKAK